MKPPLTRIERFVALFLTLALLNGCGSTLCMSSKRNLQPSPPDPRPVYVTNPELKHEYEILRASGVYRLSTDARARALTLRPVQQYAGGCGNALILSAFTLGIIPITLPASYAFEYDLENNGETEERVHHLPVHIRVSVWEWLIRRDDREALAEALAWSRGERRSEE